MWVPFRLYAGQHLVADAVNLPFQIFLASCEVPSPERKLAARLTSASSSKVVR